ncbi:unnamed protein product [Danaus chrysippus]|uniref:(African queen) hypothetical protein n=1 Tax=Danaus chrysippus TaxID=151541 RepID=A0A8J2R2J5_9NEOP|nr:unnamed protein product [Danaus chrysippus]
MDTRHDRCCAKNNCFEITLLQRFVAFNGFNCFVMWDIVDDGLTDREIRTEMSGFASDGVCSDWLNHEETRSRSQLTSWREECGKHGPGEEGGGGGGRRKYIYIYTLHDGVGGFSTLFPGITGGGGRTVTVVLVHVSAAVL